MEPEQLYSDDREFALSVADLSSNSDFFNSPFFSSSDLFH